MHKLHPLALGVAVGVLWAVYIFIAGIIAIYAWGTTLVQTFASLYLGYGPSVLGAIIGAVWAFVDGFVAGVVVAWVYNLIARPQPTSKA